jgi:AraC-like DNA-binding protein
MVSDEYPKIYLYRRLVQAKLYIDRFYFEQIDLDNISEEANFSKFHFIRLFKSVYGTTPHQYLTLVRIGKAQQLLQLGESVKSVCLGVGFDSVTTFSGLFTRIVGKTPSEYAAAYRERKVSIERSPLSFVPSCYAFMHGWDKNSNIEEDNS